ncbi:hypothetical protein BD414DRAFT_505822 [Trametes punicea]|nr:hypothetical protein BD414DRAFT_505822 [Trametes punicea]
MQPPALLGNCCRPPCVREDHLDIEGLPDLTQLKVSKMVERQCHALTRQWGTEIENYMLFAGLFSAVLTAFNVESYKLLKPSGTATGNATLASAFIGILVLQCLNMLYSDLPGDSRLAARLRQKRLNSLTKWRVEAFVQAVPCLLQIALALFIAGLLVLLWSLKRSVAILVSAPAGAFTIGHFVIVLWPPVNPGCAYWSSQIAFLNSTWRKHDRSSTATSQAKPRREDSYRHVKSRHSHERLMINDDFTRTQLDIDILTTAYDATLQAETLANSAACLMDEDYRFHSDVVVDWYQRISQNSELGNTVRSFTIGGHNVRTVLWTRALWSLKSCKREWKSREKEWKAAAYELASARCIELTTRREYMP